MKLPSAPLLEVIFELRWKVVNTGGVFGYDPGFAPFVNAFKGPVTASGFAIHEPVPQPGPPLVHQIAFRYRKKDESFPLLQIGHGIFACNVSTDYEWTAFRKLIADAVQMVLSAYPDTSVTPLVPELFELRYVDVFNESLLGNVSWQHFISAGTKMKFATLAYLDSIAIPARDQANLGLQLALKNSDLGRFELQIGNGQSSGAPSILVTSKVVKSDFGDVPPSRASLHPLVTKWADDAHEITHKFFEEFVADSLMAHFRKA